MFDGFKIVFGLTLGVSLVLPSHFIASIFASGWYVSVGNALSPTAYIAFNLVVELLPAFVVAWAFMRFARLRSRVATPVPGGITMLVGGILVLTLPIVRLLLSMSESGSALLLGLREVAPLLLLVGEPVVVVGVVRLLMAVEPAGSRTVSEPPVGAPAGA